MADEKFPCPVCGRVFTSVQGRGRHQSFAHREEWKPASSTLVKQRSRERAKTPGTGYDQELLDEVAEAMALATAGLRERLAKVEEELSEAEARVNQVTGTRRYLVAAIRRVDPEFQVAPHKTASGLSRGRPRGSGIPAKAKRIEELVLSLNGNEITTTDVKEMLDQRGGDPISLEVVRNALRDLHGRGVLRLDRKDRGGGSIYQLVGGGHGA